MKREADRETLIQVARTSLRTKVHKDLADLLTEVSFNACSIQSKVWKKLPGKVINVMFIGHV